MLIVNADPRTVRKLASHSLTLLRVNLAPNQLLSYLCSYIYLSSMPRPILVDLFVFTNVIHKRAVNTSERSIPYRTLNPKVQPLIKPPIFVQI